MAMSVGGSGGGMMCDINTTPLIDVMLVLLVTLIVSLPIMTHAVKLDMPQANNPPPQDLRPEVIDLEVDFDGRLIGQPESGLGDSGAGQVRGRLAGALRELRGEAVVDAGGDDQLAAVEHLAQSRPSGGG